MSIKTTRNQQLLEFSMHPPHGWIRKVRNQLGITGTQLAASLGVSKQRISALEKAEISGSVAIKTMQQTAEALGCEFVYALVPITSSNLQPEENVRDIEPDAPELTQPIALLCNRFGIKSLGLYGPAACGQLELSDHINLLAEFDSEQMPTQQAIEAIELEFKHIFGRTCLISTQNILEEPEQADVILADFKLIYAA